MCAWRAGFWPWPAVSTWPRMVSETSLGRDAGALERGLDRRGAELVRRRVGEGAVEAADRRARGRGDYDVGHLPHLLGRGSGSGPRAGIRGRIAAGASGRPSSHNGPGGSTGRWRAAARKSAIGRQTCGRGEAADHHADVAGPRAQRRGRRGSPRPSGSASGGGAMVSRSPQKTSAGAAIAPRVDRSRRGSASAPVAVRLRICQPISRSLAPPAPASARRRPASPRARRTAAPPAPSGSSRASFWNFSAAWIGLTSAKSIWKTETGTMPKASPRPSSSASARALPVGADHRAEAAGDAAGRGEVPGRADGDERGDVVGRAARRARRRACRPCSSRAPAPAAPASRARRARAPAAAARRRRRRGRSAPRPARARPSRAAAAGSPSAASQRSSERPGDEVEDVGAVDQARHHQHRRPVRVAARLRDRAVVEQPRAAGLPDRRRVGEAAAVGMRLPDLEPGDRRLQARGDLAGDLELVEVGPSAAALGGEAVGPGKARAVGARRRQQRLAVGRERGAEVEDQRARLADPVRRGRLHHAGGRRPGRSRAPSHRRLRRACRSQRSR